MKRAGKSWFIGLVAVPTILVLIVLLITQTGRITEMDTSTCRQRVRTYVGGINWTSSPTDSKFTPLLAGAPQPPAEWKAIAGGLNGARVNYLWGQVAASMGNAADWMVLNNVPQGDQQAIAVEFMRLARRDGWIECVCPVDQPLRLLNRQGEVLFQYPTGSK